MSDINAAWREQRRWRWMKPNTALWIRPNAKLYLKPKSYEPKADQHEPDIAAEIDALLRLKRELAAIKAELRFRRLLRTIKKYNPSQPRVPAGPRAMR